jgi:CRISPR-associated endonuclease/helicase Cas3
VYAHSLPGEPEERWEPLARHLAEVSELAGRFAAAFESREWGELAGLWHDLGKYSAAFQSYLRRTATLPDEDPHRLELRGTVNHSTAGALQALQELGTIGRLLAYCIAGHHAGLPNSTAADGEQSRSGLDHRLQHPPPETIDALRRAPASILHRSCPPPPALKLDGTSGRGHSFQLALFIRMLFSCLVDADFLRTECFMRPDRAQARSGKPPAMGELASHLDRYLQQLCATADDTHVNRQRDRVLRACLDAAQRSPGLFALTVPTGGGKTLSSLAFALRHAAFHELKRVIVAIPFTSIIEQNAAVYRRALAGHIASVLEHHSNVDPRSDNEQTARERLAAENWDAPVIVTTNVQLLESLFASRTSRCRKLHRISRSVIVLDEAQALPPNLLAPTLMALRELVINYGCSLVLCTATQPALERREDFRIGLNRPHQIIPIPEREQLFAVLKRVEVERAGTLDDKALVDRLTDEPQVLCIVNTRAHAADLFTALTERLEETQRIFRDGREQRRAGTCLHLSANMCPHHRTIVLRLIRQRLKMGLPCRVVSTQLVEAGVDVDFPVVFRAMAGLDSIAQAAGRCNREGRLAGRGRVVIFEPDGAEHLLPQFVRQAVNAASQVLSDHVDPLSPEAQHHYFRLHYWDEGHRSGWDRPPGARPDEGGVLDCFTGGGNCLQFRKAAERYRLIADDQQPIVVPYGKRGRDLARSLLTMREPPDRGFDRQLQRFIVGLHERGVRALLGNTALYPSDQTHGRFVLSNASAYDRLLGLRLDVAGMDPERLIS